MLRIGVALLLLACLALPRGVGAQEPTPSVVMTWTVDGPARLAGLGSLRETVLASGDVEARLWRLAFGTEGYVLRRRGGRWSAAVVRRRRSPAGDSVQVERDHEAVPLPDTAVARTWAALVAAGLLTLRDAPARVPSSISVFDGESYVLEVRRGDEYRIEGFAWVDAVPGEIAAPVRRLYAAAAALGDGARR